MIVVTQSISNIFVIEALIALIAIDVLTTPALGSQLFRSAID